MCQYKLWIIVLVVVGEHEKGIQQCWATEINGRAQCVALNSPEGHQTQQYIKISETAN